MWVHGQVFKVGVELGVFVGTSLVDFYSGFGDLEIAHQVFDEMPVKDAIAWAVILSGYVNRCGDMGRAQELFDTMPVKDLVAWNTMINGYGM